MKAPKLLTLIAVLMLTAGCETPEIDMGELEKERAATKVEREKEAAKPKEGYLADGRLDMSGIAGEPPMTTSTPREVTAKDPKHGKLSRQAGGYLGATVDKIPYVKHKMIFDMIKYNLNIYDADRGHFPKSHQEFMEVYLPGYYAVALPLPELEAGDEYIYDPEDHLLKIHRPETPTASETSAETPTAETTSTEEGE